MSSSLTDWQENGWLREHRTSREEIADLLALADRDLAPEKRLISLWHTLGTDAATVGVVDAFRRSEVSQRLGQTL